MSLLTYHKLAFVRGTCLDVVFVLMPLVVLLVLASTNLLSLIDFDECHCPQAELLHYIWHKIITPRNFYGSTQLEQFNFIMSCAIYFLHYVLFLKQI